MKNKNKNSFIERQLSKMLEPYIKGLLCCAYELAKENGYKSDFISFSYCVKERFQSGEYIDYTADDRKEIK